MRVTGASGLTGLTILGLAMLLPMAAISAPAQARKTTAGNVVRASEAGAALDADLMQGGGTDDTAALQAVLDRASTGRPVHLIVDGVARVGGLNVYGKTTVECISGGGLYLKDGASRAIIRNVHRSRDAIVDDHITIRGCFLHGNRAHQPGAHPEREPSGNNQEADGTFITALQFLGVNYLTIENVTMWNARSFGALIGNGRWIDIRDVTVHHGGPADVDREYLQTDGLHFKGPLQYVTIDGLKLRTGDDALAFNADDMLTDDLTVRNEFGPYVRHGPIQDVTVNNVQLMDSLFGFRFLSSKQRIDRVVINNVVGTINGPRLAVISNYLGPSPGNIGSIEFNNVNVDRAPDARFVARFREDMEQEKERFRAGYDENNGGIATLLNINTHVESLSLRNIRTTATDERPLVRLGPNAKIKQMLIELSVQDPDLRAVPVELDEKARIEQLRFALDWKGEHNDVSKNPIARLGGSIGELRWVNTPPKYVDATLTGRSSIRVRFSQEVKASSYAAGVRIQVNGAAARIVRAVRDASELDAVHYEIDKAVGSKDRVSWAYRAADGVINNMSGEDLLTVEPKPVGPGQGIAVSEMRPR